MQCPVCGCQVNEGSVCHGCGTLIPTEEDKKEREENEAERREFQKAIEEAKRMIRIREYTCACRYLNQFNNIKHWDDAEYLLLWLRAVTEDYTAAVIRYDIRHDIKGVLTHLDALGRLPGAQLAAWRKAIDEEYQESVVKPANKEGKIFAAAAVVCMVLMFTFQNYSLLFIFWGWSCFIIYIYKYFFSYKKNFGDSLEKMEEIIKKTEKN